MTTSIENKLIEEYWVNKLSKIEFVNPSVKEISSTERIVISKEETVFFDKLTGGQPIAEFTIGLAIYSVLLQRYFSNFDGIVSANNGMVGQRKLKNPLAFSFSSCRSNVFKKYLQEVKKETLETFGYENYDLSKLQERLNGINLTDLIPFGLSFNTDQEDHLSGLFCFCLSRNDKNEIEVYINYARDFIENNVATHFLNTIRNWIVNLESYLGLSIHKIPILSEEERYELLENFNSTHLDYPENKTIITLYEEQVLKTPNKQAVVFENKKYSYEDLNKEVNRLAHYLVNNFQVGNNSIVGILLPKSDYALLSILAILKTGATYLPIDPNYPNERINYIIRDSKLELLLCNESTIDIIDFSNKVRVDEFSYRAQEIHNLDKVISPFDPAYIIYTSGSTGVPKGVPIAHTSNVNMSLYQSKIFNVTDKDSVIWFASIAFDASVSEIMMALYSGACLAIPKEEDIIDVNNLIQFLKEKKVTVATFPPSYLNLLNVNDINGLKSIITAGEAAYPEKALEVLESGVNYFNAYGPTECSVCVSIHKVTKADKNQSFISIGKPIANLSVYILDKNLEPVPIGVEGMLYVSGVGLTAGYLNKPDLTKERFINNPFITNDIIYDTGDIVKWLPDGNIKFIGRGDTQVKIRGHRIELGEIENTFLKHFKETKQVSVTLKQKQGEDVLVAYYSGENIESAVIRKKLEKNLPGYMIPSYFISVPVLPLTTNGKINYNALPDIENTQVNDTEYVAPQTESEIELVKIWKEIIGVHRIGIKDNFFVLGGHSLKVMLLVNKIKQRLGTTIKVKDFFQNPTIEGITEVMQKDVYSPISKVVDSTSYPLTPSQNRLWILSQFEGGNSAYNIPIAVQLNGNLEEEKLETSLRYLIRRHESLRTVFRNEDKNEVEQIILDDEDINFNIQYTDLSSTTNKEEHLLDIVKESYQYEFDLSEGPLLKVDIIKLTEEENVLIFCIHHIIGDGWSMQILVSELSSVYNTLKLDEKPELDPLKIQYKDYSIWLNDQLGKDVFKEKEQFWLNTLSGELPVLELPSYQSRPKIKTYKGASLNFEFTREFYDQVDHYKHKNELTLFMILMSGLNGLFYRYTGNRDILLGTVVAGREHQDIENQIGLYLNTLAIRTQFENAKNFKELTREQKETLLNAYTHQEYPFDTLIDKLNVKRNSSRSALFDVMVVLQNQQNLTDDNLLKFDGLDLIPYRNSNTATSKFDMTFSFTEEEDKLSLNLEYNTDIYAEATITKLMSHFENFVIEGIKNEEKELDLIDYLDFSEKEQILKNFNNTNVDYPGDSNIVVLFREQVQKSPDQLALVFGGIKFTYKELDEYSNTLAHHLRIEKTIEVEDRIGISLQQSEWLIISILAVLKVGAAYVPIDVDFPKERKRYIEEDCDCLFIIDDRYIELFKSNYRKSNIPIDTQISSNNAAYIIYTSGSTGKPKGVLIEHKSVIRLVKPCNYFSLNETNILLSTGSISFDATIIEYFGTLLNGSTLVVAKKEELLASKTLKQIITTNKVNSFWMTASWFRQIVETQVDIFDDLKQIIVGGDIVSPFHTNKVLERNPNLKVVNGYGPTENTTFSATYPIEQKKYITIPIGKPISNSTAYIVNDRHQINPVGVIGELCVSGDGLAREYINQPELTNEKFVDNPFIKGSKMYKTGDLTRWLPDGNIEFIGRKDAQVKIRGYRIEIGEIEYSLLQQENIGQAFVKVDQVNDIKSIIAYITSSTIIDKQQLRYALLDFLPEYMIPNYFIVLEEFPLTNNGKIDSKLLPGVTSKDLIKKEYVPPGNETEQKIVAIWEEVLGMDQIGIKDNFFEAGGNSLQAIKILGKINTEFALDLTAKDFFSYQTISEFNQLMSFKAYNNTEQNDIINEEYEEITL